MNVIKSTVAALLLTLGLLSGQSILHAEGIKVQVVVQNATIRSASNLESEIVNTPPMGSVFDVVKKTENWYEIRFKSKLGIWMTGYIHQMFVEEMEADIGSEKEQEQKTEKTVPTKKIEIPPEKPPKPRSAPEEASKKLPRFELALMGGMISGTFVNTNSSYNDSWSDNLLDMVDETGHVQHELKKNFGFGASMSYFLFGGLGIQIRFDANSKAEIETQEQGSTYMISWSWTSSSDTFDSEEAWPVKGEFTLSPISFNLIYKVQTKGMFAPYVNCGLSYFTGNFKVDTTRGFGFSYMQGTFQRIEYLSLPMSVDVSLSGMGFNVGGGLDLHFSRSLALTIDASYFVKPELKEDWKVATGSYPGINFPEISWNITEELADMLGKELPQIKFTPSFFKIQGGFKISF